MPPGSAGAATLGEGGRLRGRHPGAEAQRVASARVAGVVYAEDRVECAADGASAAGWGVRGPRDPPGASAETPLRRGLRGPLLDGSVFARPNTALGRTRSTSASGEPLRSQRVLRRGAHPYMASAPDAAVSLDGSPRASADTSGEEAGVDASEDRRPMSTTGVTRGTYMATTLNLAAQLDGGSHLDNTIDPVTRSLTPGLGVHWSNASTPRPSTPEVDLRVKFLPVRRRSLAEHFARASLRYTSSSKALQARTLGELYSRFVTGSPTHSMDVWTRLDKQAAPPAVRGAKLVPLLGGDPAIAMRAHSPSRGYGAIGHNAKLSATWKQRIPSARLRPSTLPLAPRLTPEPSRPRPR